MYFEDVLPDLRNGAVIQRSGAKFCMKDEKIYHILNGELQLYENLSGGALCANDWKIFSNPIRQSSYKPKTYKDLSEKLCIKHNCTYILEEAEKLINSQNWKAYDRYHNTNKISLRGYTIENGIDAAWGLIYSMILAHFDRKRTLNVEENSGVKIISSYHNNKLMFEFRLTGVIDE
jgi:hypothetical protein